MDVVRITELQPKTYVEQGDYIAIDNQSDGTKKVQFTNLLDDTLSQENKIAPANVVGDEIATIRAAVGSPLKASTVAQMTDKNKIYVYVGSESGYTNGNWYYWNGSAWTSGGVYNSVAVVTDPTLTLSGVPADAKATGDEVTNLETDLTQETNARVALTGRVITAEANISTLTTHKVAQPLDDNNQPTDGTNGQSLRTKGDGTTEWADVGLPTDVQTAQAVSDWLDAHPEATTTVEDGSLVLNKFKLGELPFVTPEMYGAKGDGIVDDTEAWQSAVDSGFNVRATKKSYKCGKIEVTKNIDIDFNGADFICTAETFLHCHGEVITTLTGQTNYVANESLYSIIDSNYSNYTGFAMLKGENNFEESRSYYLGGFVCTFKNGLLNGSYPIDVTKNNGIDIEIVNPIIVRLFNIGNVSHNTTTGDSIIIEYGFNCLIENVNADSISKYVFIDLKKSLNCVCNQIKAFGLLGSTGTNSYLIAFSDSSYCSVENSYLYNKYWHAVTTGANYLCFHNMVFNSKLFSDATAYCDHENAKNTIISNCVVNNIGVSGMAVVADTIVMANPRQSTKECFIGIFPASDPNSTGAVIRNIKFIPSSDTVASVFGINIATFPQVTGKTYYADYIQIENIESVGEPIPRIWFGFNGATANNYVAKSIIINNANCHIELGSLASMSLCFDISGYKLEVLNINKTLKNQLYKNVIFGQSNGVYNDVIIHNCRFHALRGAFSKIEAHNVYSLGGINNTVIKFKTFIGSGLDFYMPSPSLFISSDPNYPASYVRITDINNQSGSFVMFNVANDNAGNKYYQRWVNGVLTTQQIT